MIARRHRIARRRQRKGRFAASLPSRPHSFQIPDSPPAPAVIIETAPEKNPWHRRLLSKFRRSK
jgi:hypothetical protein